jgi:AcrR family transcriptional regulator
MIESPLDTKVKIMQVARILFADHGFEGTSIRDIARQAQVNVASVNYHFSNKENLFDEIIQVGHRECSEALRSFYEKNDPDLEETLIYLFHYFLERSHDLISYFKMMMSSQHSQRVSTQTTEDTPFGPPGGAVIIDAIKKNIHADLSDQNLHWALKSLFGHVTHMSLMYECCFKRNEIPFSSVEDLEQNIRKLSRLVMKDLREGPN